MKYDLIEKNGVLEMQFHGKVMVGHEANDFHDRVKEHIENGRNKLIANLTDVTFMNSSGISLIIRALTSARNAGGDLHICCASERIMALLNATRLLTVIHYFDTLEEAVEAF